MNSFEIAQNNTVYGRASQATLDAIDQVADQGLLSRAGVITQILEDWATRRAAEIRELESTWDASQCRHVSDLKSLCDEARILLAQ